MNKTLVFTLILLGVAWSTSAQPATIAAQGYARETPPGPPMSAAFVSLHNTGRSEQVLTGIELPGLEGASADLHSTISEGGVNRMRPLQKVVIAAGAHLEMVPGGLHLMINGLRLQAGDQLPLRLLFSDGSSVDILLPIVGLSDDSENHHHHQHG
ncbi:copper chaperone PCu(A)C [Microbulbifer sp. OS29]|uniref:Copper chaperone PCu(A)C n=1 Tax=Microbulbifer okhotskensis TaxID=2926617 RepID=A0A9X2EJJ4_9GAMM|nr:copper chaperone PCu(A)C [Microbulbifer okhotskensis]MCO1333439.1 copper chaperone PCu(A)C [Microbulbifer okhotskensis]